MMEHKWWAHLTTLSEQEVSAVGFDARVLADSVAKNGCRLTTLEVTFPRIVLAELNTHRVFSRNSASSRAIPTWKQLLRVLEDPFVPLYWGTNQPGMQAENQLGHDDRIAAEKLWLESRDAEVLRAIQLSGGIDAMRPQKASATVKLEFEKLYSSVVRLYGEQPAATKTKLSEPLHKQTVNRLLEPFMWHKVIVTATEWDNFWALRISPMAQPEINRAAELMKLAFDASTPSEVGRGEWHLPLLQPDELEWAASNPGDAAMVSAGRCARVSYLTHDGQRDPAKDIELCRSLMNNGHMSPLEHVGTPMRKKEFKRSQFSGNFRGWVQYRKLMPHESNFAEVLASLDT